MSLYLSVIVFVSIIVFLFVNAPHKQLTAVNADDIHVFVIVLVIMFWFVISPHW